MKDEACPLFENLTNDIDYINISDIVPDGVVKDSVHNKILGYFYPYKFKSETKSAVARFVLKVGELAPGVLDGSFMVVDIGGNCGYCRSYFPSGKKDHLMFGWEIEGCKEQNIDFALKSNSWYAFEQGRIRVTSGENQGKDYIYIKINGELITSFYGESDSRPIHGDKIYIESTHNFQIVGYDELRVKYFVDGKLYLDSLAQRGFNVIEPQNPQKDGSYFINWYTEEDGGKPFDFSNVRLNEDLNLYARFTTESVTAIFNPDNGDPAFSLTVGKGCLIPKISTPVKASGKYAIVFDGWRNDETGEKLDLLTARPEKDSSFTATYREKEHYVSYYACGKLVNKVPFLMSCPTVKGKEPPVPKIANTIGAWEDHSVSGLTGDITVNARYTVVLPSASDDIKPEEFGGKEISLNDSRIDEYLNAGSFENQTAFVRKYCVIPFDYLDHQNISFKWSDCGKNSSYTVYFSDNKDFKNAFIVTSDKPLLENSVGIFVPGKTYYWFVYGNDTGKSGKTDSFYVKDTPLRYITAGNVTNMRDMGGYKTADGNRVKYGMIYRGGSLDEHHSHCDDAARNVFNYLGIKSEIELRGDVVHDKTGWDENSDKVYIIEAQGYEPILDTEERIKPQYTEAFSAMADKENYPFYFHCSAGADRTGAFAYLILALLGVPYKNIREDYELTSFSEVNFRTADTFLEFSFDRMNSLILEKYGDGTDNLQAAVRNFLVSFFGVENTVIEAIRKNMLED